MCKQIKFTFFRFKKSKYIKIFIPFLLIFIFFIGVMYCSLLLKKKFLSAYQNSNLNLKTIIENSVIKKYYYLLTEKHIDLLSEKQSTRYKNFDHISQSVRLHAEFLQMITGIKDINFILYDQNCRAIFSNLNPEDYSPEQLLTSDEIDNLLENKEVHYTKEKSVISIFPIFYGNTIKPLFFLKVLKNYDESCIAQYNLFLASISLLLIILMMIMYYLNISSTRVLAKQHKTNIELQKVKEVLEQENANKIKFFATVTHELRTPLNAIIGFADLIKNMNFMDNLKCKEYADDIYSAGKHLLSLINDVLDLSKAEASNLVVKKVKFNLNKIIDSSLNMLLPKLKDAEITLKKEIPETQLLITADPQRMKQVIINLLSNAIKFTPKNGLIKMVIKENIEKNLLIIEFHDNGIGIMQQDIYKVMSFFGQADSGYRNEGTGLGLPLSKKLVELMGGTFSIKSESKIGTIITLNFFYEEQTCEDSINF